MVSSSVRRFLSVCAVLALTLFLLPARAQYGQSPAVRDPLADPTTYDWTGDVPAHLAYVEGQVTLERDGTLEPAETNTALLAGDRIRTLGGRVEILFPDGSTISVDEHSELDLLSDSLIRLRDGCVRLSIPRATEELDYRIDAPVGYAEIRAAGDYRLETGVDRSGDPNVELTVFRGTAELVNDLGRTLVRAGRAAITAAAAAPSLPYAVNSNSSDEFDEWVEDRRDSRVVSASATYLPEETQYYSSTLDDYGTWNYDVTYGSVWYPRVSMDWRPYSQGRWSFSAHFGWLWVGIDRWSWPTHHYGRWGFSANRWFWIPQRQWSPAWVSWGGAPGYVSWCPLGYNNRPVIGWSTSYGDPWRAWTVLPSNSFRHNVWVTEHVVLSHAIAPAARTQFAERRIAPSPAGYATPRAQVVGLHAPTAPRNVAVPRQQRGGGSAGPFDSARPPGRANAAPQGPINSTIIGSPSRPQDSRGAQGGGARAVQPDRTPPDRAISNDRTPPPDRGNEIKNFRTPPPDRSVQGDRSLGSPSRVVPNSQGSRDPGGVTARPPVNQPVNPGYDNSRGGRVQPDRTQPPVSTYDPSRDRGRGVERNSPPPPPVSSAPPPSYGSRRQDPPPQAAPPPSRPAPPPQPSRGQGGDKMSPPPSSSAPPPSQGSTQGSARGGRGGGGGGDDQPKAVPRRGGGRGGR